MLFVAHANAFVAGAAGQAVSHLAPQRAGEQSWLQGESIGGVGVLPVEGGDAGGACRGNPGIDEGLGRWNAFHSTDGVHQGDEGVGLTTAVLRPQPDDGGYLASFAGETE